MISPEGTLSSMLGRALSGTRDFIFSRGGSVLLGLVLVLLLIWYAGPWIGLKSEFVRWVVIGAVVGVATIVWIVRWVVTRRRGRQLERDLQDSAMLGTRPDRATEIAALRKQMHDAIGALKSSELGTARTGSAALYALPWYMVIGPSAVGKSTILRNSGLNFPYSKHDPRGIQGVGGTRNCDWWFSDQAIFLDTAGRYTTEEDDREEWLAFLDMLRKNRVKQPINGVVVAIAIAELLTCGPDAVAHHAKVARERIDELVTRLGIVFPVYLIFTKCDLIKGFVPFFEDLSDPEREQVWGAALMAGDTKGRDPGDVFEQEFDALYTRLCTHRLAKLALQRNIERKLDIVDFPSEFQAAGGRLTEFVQQLFKKHPFKETPLCNGFFFTSGAQEGAPIQRIVGSLMQAFGAANDPAPAPAAGQKSYFIHKVLKEVVLPNSRQVSRNRRNERQSRWMKRAAIFASLIVAVGGIMVFSAAYARKMLLIAEVEDSSRHLATVIATPRLDLSTASRATFAYYDATAELWDDRLQRVSLYQPGGFEIPLAQSFLAAMESIFLVPVAAMLEERLRGYVQYVGARQRGQDPDFAAALESGMDNVAAQELAATKRSRRTAEAYESLKLHLFLNSPDIVSVSEVLEPFAAAWIAALKRQGVRVDDLDTGRLKPMAAFYLNAMRAPAAAPIHARGWQSDKTLVAATRSAIHEVPSAERLYADMRDVGSRKFDGVDLVALLGSVPRGSLTSKYVIPGIYTRKGWDDFVSSYLEHISDSALRSDWVLGTKDDIDEVPAEQARAHLQRQIRQMYFADYANHWFSMLASISARNYDSLHDASTELQSFIKDDGTVVALFKNLRKNVELTERGGKGLPGIGVDKERGVAVAAPPMVEELRVPFKFLSRLLQQVEGGKENNWFEQYRKSLVAVQKDIARLSSASDVARDTRVFATKVLDGDTESEVYRSWVTVNQVLEDSDARTSQALSTLLRAPIRNVWGSIVGVAQKDLDRNWKNKVYFTFNETLATHYPFAKDGRDASLQDVSEFFRANGTILTFINQELRPFLERKGASWEARRWLGVGMEFSPEFLQALERTSLVGSALFKQGETSPTLGFSVYPYPTPGLSESTLHVDGAEYRYRNGPQEWHNFTWPGPNPGARVRGVRAGTLTSGQVSVEGPWAFLRLLSMAHISPQADGSFVATWSVRDSSAQSMTVTFRIRPDRYANPLGQNALAGYRLPPEIFSRGEPSDIAKGNNKKSS